MSIAMNRDEREQFLAGVHVGILNIPSDARGPLSCPVWYEYQAGGEVSFVTPKDSRKGRLLETGTRVSFCVQTEELPPKYVSVEGPITSITPAELERDVRPLAYRYLGPELGDQYIEVTGGTAGRANAILVKMRPARWRSADYSKQFSVGGDTAT